MRPTRYSFTTGRSFAPLPWRSILDTLSRELKRAETEAIFQKRVFFIQNLDFIAPTEARRISFEESLRFERVHEEIYRNFGFEFVPIAPGSVLDRADAIKRSASVGAKWFITV